jgi:hypothetical protein
LALLASKGAKAALTICPTRPRTAELSLNCALALASDSQAEAAQPLFRCALADRYATPQMYREVIGAKAQMQDQAGAFKTLDEADSRFGGGQFYPDRISLQLRAGDKSGAQATADRCRAEGDTTLKTACARLMLQDSRSGT